MEELDGTGSVPEGEVHAARMGCVDEPGFETLHGEGDAGAY